MRRRASERSANVPAWLPRLDASDAYWRIASAGAALFMLTACLSYGVLRATGAVSRDVAEAPAVPPIEFQAVQAKPAPSAPTAASAETELEKAAETAPFELPEGESAATLKVITGRIPKGGTVFETLRAQGVTPQRIHQVAASMRPTFNFKRAREGDFFALIQDSEGELLSFEFQRGRTDIYRLERGPDGELRTSYAEVPLERRVVHLAGVVEKSLFEALIALGEGPDLVNEFADIFVWDFDFGRQTRPGDEFRLVYEKYYDKEGFVRYGAILAGQYKTGERDYTAVYFEDSDGYGDYYTPEGNSVRRTFLRAPVRYSRISSRYSNSRLHPILKVRRPHHGVDYAAPMGTPCWAVADGEVIFRGWSGGFGRLVKIRHNNGYVSYYGHLSRYGGDVGVGGRVRQKQVIGYVGSSGLSSGPHLDYRLQVNGRFVDPMRARFPTGQPIPVVARDRFELTKAERLAELNDASPGLVLEAAM